MDELHRLCESESKDGLEVIPDRGSPLHRGVRTTRRFRAGHYVCSFEGELIRPAEHQRWKRIYDYDADPKTYCSFVVDCTEKLPFFVDATEDNPQHFGRLINHDHRPNVWLKHLLCGPAPHHFPRFYYEALRDIAPKFYICSRTIHI